MLRSIPLLAMFVTACASAFPRPPRYATTRPPPQPAVPAAQQVAIDQVAIAAPDDDVSWTRFGDFRAHVSAAGVIAAPPAVGRRVDIRSDDAVLSWERYRRLRCGFTASDADLRYNRACEDEPAGTAFVRSRGVIDTLLADLRGRAAALGSRAVEDVRCYGAVDGYRVWCEAAAVVP